MYRICMFAHINGLNLGRMTMVSELGLIGSGVLEEPICLEYDTSCYNIDAEKRKIYGLNNTTDGPLRSVHEYLLDIKNFYEFERSKSRPLVGIFGDREFGEILRANLIPYLDLSQVGMTEESLEFEENYCCSLHSNSIMGCPGQRVAAFRDWVLRKCDGREMAQSKRLLLKV